MVLPRPPVSLLPAPKHAHHKTASQTRHTRHAPCSLHMPEPLELIARARLAASTEEAAPKHAAAAGGGDAALRVDDAGAGGGGAADRPPAAAARSKSAAGSPARRAGGDGRSDPAVAALTARMRHRVPLAELLRRHLPAVACHTLVAAYAQTSVCERALLEGGEARTGFYLGNALSVSLHPMPPCHLLPHPAMMVVATLSVESNPWPRLLTLTPSPLSWPHPQNTRRPRCLSTPPPTHTHTRKTPCRRGCPSTCATRACPTSRRRSCSSRRSPSSSRRCSRPAGRRTPACPCAGRAPRARSSASASTLPAPPSWPRRRRAPPPPRRWPASGPCRRHCWASRASRWRCCRRSASTSTRRRCARAATTSATASRPACSAASRRSR